MPSYKREESRAPGEMGRSRPSSNWLQESALILVGAILFPSGMKALLGKELTWSHSITFGLLVTIIGMLVRYHITLSNWRAESMLGWIAGNEFDKKLILMRESYVQLKEASPELFVAYVEDHAQQFASQIKKAVTTNELPLKPTLDIREHLLRNMGRNEPLLLVHFYEDNEEVFGPGAYWRGFQQQIRRAVEERRIPTVRRLFIYDEESEKTDELSSRIKDEQDELGFEYVEISKRHYQEQLRDSNIPADTHDFGIYGAVVVRWPGPRTETDTAVMIAEKASVRAFVSAFERCWDLGTG